MRPTFKQLNDDDLKDKYNRLTIFDKKKNEKIKSFINAEK